MEVVRLLRTGDFSMFILTLFLNFFRLYINVPEHSLIKIKETIKFSGMRISFGGRGHNLVGNHFGIKINYQNANASYQNDLLKEFISQAILKKLNSHFLESIFVQSCNSHKTMNNITLIENFFENINLKKKFKLHVLLKI